MAQNVFYSLVMCKGCSKSNASYFIILAMMTEMVVGGMAVEVEPSHQYSACRLLFIAGENA